MKKSALISILVISLVALLAVGTWAWFTANAEPSTNTFTAGTVEIEINETYTPVTEWNPGQTSNKDLWVKSLGSKQTYVRVSLTPVWGNEDDEGFVAEPGLPVDNVTLNWNQTDWVYSDGWYYYKSILAAGAKTSLLLQSVTLSSSTGDEYQGKVLQIVASAEAVQASHEAYQDAWGLTSLPAGVQEWTP